MNEKVPFRTAPLLEQGQHERYGLYPETATNFTLFEHCRRALDKGLTLGMHNLPLIGSGDWNDGMNMIGIKGKGESIWLGFFLYETLLSSQSLPASKRTYNSLNVVKVKRTSCNNNIEQNGWDGEWYRRAYFDDGSPLGSASNQECKIDYIAQSWSVLSGAGDTKRSRMAMEALDKNLVRREHNLIQLLDPPFDKSNLNPGYIKGYVPGVRENGGQYTHAAIWAAMAFAREAKRYNSHPQPPQNEASGARHNRESKAPNEQSTCINHGFHSTVLHQPRIIYPAIIDRIAHLARGEIPEIALQVISGWAEIK